MNTTNRLADKDVSASERMALLHALAFTAQRLSVAQFEGFTSRLIEILSRHAAHSADAGEAQVYRHAEQHLSQHRLTFHRLFSDSLQQELLQAAQASLVAGEEGGMLDPALASFDAMERRLLIDHLCQLHEESEPDVLAALGLRIACWRQSEPDGATQNRRNPFRPEVFLNAFAGAWQKFDITGKTHLAVLRQLRPEIFLPLGSVWQALSRELAARGIMPDAEEKCRNRADQPDGLPERLRRRLAPGGRLKLERVAELLDAMFERIAQEKAIPIDIRAVLAQLKAPLHEAALSDMRFFFSDKHPARRMIDAFIDSALAHEACENMESRTDPSYQALAGTVGEICREGAHAELCERVTRDLQAMAARQTAQADNALREATEVAIEQESVAHSEQLAQDDVASRIQTGEVAGFVEAFLQEQWTRVLSFAYGVRDTRPDVLPSVLRAMDDLIWSVKPKSNVEDRKALIDRLPALISLLNVWLNVVKWEGEERQSFFVALAERHAALMRGPAGLTPRDQLEIRMNTVQKASEHHLSRRALEQQEAALADFMHRIDALAPGDWVTFVRNNGGTVNCRLAWISPGRSRLIFIGRHGQLVFPMESRKLAEALRADRASLISIDLLAAALEQSGA